MNFPLSRTAFRAQREVLFGEALAHLRLAARLPLRVSCRCLAYWDDLALEHLRFERDVDLGTCRDLASAMAQAATAVASGLIAAGRDAALRQVPQFVTILDAEHCLVLAGEVQHGCICWYAPVDSAAEARRVVSEACGLRAKARGAADAGDPAAAGALLNRARALEGRLVHPFWRDLAQSVVEHAQAA